MCNRFRSLHLASLVVESNSLECEFMGNLLSFLDMSVRKTELLKKFGAVEVGRTVIKGDRVGIVHLGKVRWLTQSEMDILMRPEPPIDVSRID